MKKSGSWLNELKKEKRSAGFKDTIGRLGGVPSRLKVKDILAIALEMKLLPNLRETQTRSLATVAQGVFQFRNEQHSEKKLFSIISEVSLRSITFRFVWECGTLNEQLFVLNGIHLLFSTKMPISPSMKPTTKMKMTSLRLGWAKTRPKKLERSHYQLLVSLLRELWSKLEEYSIVSKRSGIESFLCGFCSDDNGALTSNTPEEKPRITVCTLLNMVADSTLNAILVIASNPSQLDLFTDKLI